MTSPKPKNEGITFDHLTDGEFESFTYDLLSALGFVNLSWRRGSGKGGATADQGRDVEAELRKREVDKTEFFEKYFVQAKHHKQGVPPEKLEGAIAWAVAARPHVLLIVASNFLSNPAKTWLREYEENNKPNFRIRVWERKDLEGLLVNNSHLIKKYKLGSLDPAEGLHPAHLQYIHHPPANTIEQLFSILDDLDPKKRDDIFAWNWHLIINPRYRKPIHKEETMGDLMLDQADYPTFKAKYLKLADETSDIFLVHAFISDTLSLLANLGDPGKVDKTIEFHQGLIDFLTKEAEAASEQKKDMINQQIEKTKQLMETVSDRQKNYEDNYKFICETILPRLSIENLGPQDADLGK